MTNLEYKAELREPELAVSICRAIGAVELDPLEQEDVYYRVTRGRFVRRRTGGQPEQYLFYERDPGVGPRLSHWRAYSREQARERFGELGLEEWVTVRKRRRVFVTERVRVHLDEVQGLGWFVEVEAAVGEDGELEDRRAQVVGVVGQLRAAMGEAIGCGYAELVAGEG